MISEDGIDIISSDKPKVGTKMNGDQICQDQTPKVTTNETILESIERNS